MNPKKGSQCEIKHYFVNSAIIEEHNNSTYIHTWLYDGKAFVIDNGTRIQRESSHLK